MPRGPRKDGKTCSLDDCPKPLYALGYCITHYFRHLRHGDPRVVKPSGGPKFIPDELRGIPQRTLKRWIDQGYVKPNRNPDTSRREWSEKEVAVVLLLDRLVTAGLTPHCAAKVARAAVLRGLSEVRIGKGIYLRMEK